MHYNIIASMTSLFDLGRPDRVADPWAQARQSQFMAQQMPLNVAALAMCDCLGCAIYPKICSLLGWISIGELIVIIMLLTSSRRPGI